jgi:hypothetical protein
MSELRTCPKEVGRRPIEVSEHGLDGRRASSAEIASVRLFVPERITGHRLEYRLWSFVSAMNSPDQETVLRAVEDARRILGEYIEPGQRDATRTVERLRAVLDKSYVVHALDRINRRRVLRLIE